MGMRGTPAERALSEWIDSCVNRLDVANTWESAARSFSASDDETHQHVGELLGLLGAILRERAEPQPPKLTVLPAEETPTRGTNDE